MCGAEARSKKHSRETPPSSGRVKANRAVNRMQPLTDDLGDASRRRAASTARDATRATGSDHPTARDDPRGIRRARRARRVASAAPEEPLGVSKPRARNGNYRAPLASPSPTKPAGGLGSDGAVVAPAVKFPRRSPCLFGSFGLRITFALPRLLSRSLAVRLIAKRSFHRRLFKNH